MTYDDTVIRLEQFLKLKGVTGTGGQAKVLIQGKKVKVNKEVETRRKRQLKVGDVVEALSEKWTVSVEDASDSEDEMFADE